MFSFGMSVPGEGGLFAVVKGFPPGRSSCMFTVALGSGRDLRFLDVLVEVELALAMRLMSAM